MNNPCKGAQADSRADRDRESVDHLSGMARDHSGTQDPIGALLDMNLHEPFLFTVSHRAINVMH